MSTTEPRGLPVVGENEADFRSAVTTLTGVGTPTLVVRPRTAHDVVRAIAYAREHGMTLTVRGGGHSMSGLSTAESGLLLDMRAMDSVQRTGTGDRVRVGAGATWGHVAESLAPMGLSLTAGDTSDVGVAGLSLGGGIGWMARSVGLAIDSLAGAELVTASGEVLHLSDDENPDLFWAIRGGGGNFGVLTWLEFEAHPVGDVVFGSIHYGLDEQGTLDALMAAWNAQQQKADRRLTSVLTVLPEMGPNPAVAMVELCFAGVGPEAWDAVRPFERLATPIAVELARRPYASILKEAEPFPLPPTAQDNALLRHLDEHTRNAIRGAFEGGELMLSVRALGGAVADVAADATAFAFRDAEAMVTATRMLGSEPTDEARLPGWDAVRRVEEGAYVNWLDTADAAAAARCYPRSTLDRLARTKAEHDPTNVFHDAVPFR